MNNSQENKNLFSKENPFRVPENYFNSFPDKILERISESESISIKREYFFNWKSTFALAASIVGILFLSYTTYYVLNNPKNSKQQTTQIADVHDAEFSFVDENYLVDALTTTSTPIEVEGDDIISFLVEDGVDENLIAEAY